MMTPVTYSYHLTDTHVSIIPAIRLQKLSRPSPEKYKLERRCTLRGGGLFQHIVTHLHYMQIRMLRSLLSVRAKIKQVRYNNNHNTYLILSYKFCPFSIFRLTQSSTEIGTELRRINLPKHMCHYPHDLASRIKLYLVNCKQLLINFSTLIVVFECIQLLIMTCDQLPTKRITGLTSCASSSSSRTDLPADACKTARESL